MWYPDLQMTLANEAAPSVTLRAARPDCPWLSSERCPDWDVLPQASGSLITKFVSVVRLTFKLKLIFNL